MKEQSFSKATKDGRQIKGHLAESSPCLSKAIFLWNAVVPDGARSTEGKSGIEGTDTKSISIQNPSKIKRKMMFALVYPPILDTVRWRTTHILLYNEWHHVCWAPLWPGLVEGWKLEVGKMKKICPGAGDYDTTNFLDRMGSLGILADWSCMTFEKNAATLIKLSESRVKNCYVGRFVSCFVLHVLFLIVLSRGSAGNNNSWSFVWHMRLGRHDHLVDDWVERWTNMLLNYCNMIYCNYIIVLFSMILLSKIVDGWGDDILGFPVIFSYCTWGRLSIFLVWFLVCYGGCGGCLLLFDILNLAALFLFAAFSTFVHFVVCCIAWFFLFFAV